MAEAQQGPSTTTTNAPDTKVYIVHMERTTEEPQQLEAKQRETLASVLGSSEAAQEALLYHYKHSIHGFSAKLTPEQANALSELPEVLQVSESKTVQLHGPGAGSTAQGV